jgi:LPXTG-motif cell wall-anchored protein
VPARRLLVVPLVAALVGGFGVAGAGAQELPSPEDLPPVSELPQTEEPPAEEPGAEQPPEEPAPESPQASELPNTGSDARVVALLGATVLLTGVGLRLRTAPERF